jgi:hypothetical protein
VKDLQPNGLYLCLAFLVLLVIAGGCSQAPTSSTRHLCFSCDSEGCDSVEEAELPTENGAGLFDQGEIDLTGDGVSERVQRLGERVVIYQEGAEVWKSPPEWQVVDLALGDPNDDGRSEVLLAFWKQDDAGVPRSHPFIIGYRGGYYRELWGGSAVDAPIREVELADVDGDRVQELIVLEEAGDGAEQAVAVWRWNQWWFNIVWRSPEGVYRDLRLTSSQNTEGLPIICVAVE